MRTRTTLVPAAVFSLTLMGCQSATPIASDESGADSATDPADLTSASLASRTATLWVKGLACPF